LLKYCCVYAACSLFRFLAARFYGALVLVACAFGNSQHSLFPSQIHDFARAYGSLCWNLSKVIPRKDLPRIFTMCLPIADEANSEAPPAALADLHQTRNDVVAEVMKAPKRRVDNVITHLYDSVHQLKLHANVSNHVRQQFRKKLWENRVQEAGTLFMGASLTSITLYTQLPMQFTGGIVAATVLGVGGLSWYNSLQLQAAERNLVSPEELSASFQRVYAREVHDADEYTSSVWQRIRDPLKMQLEAQGLQQVSVVSASELSQLDKIVEEDIPELRRVASPTHYGKKGDE
jgi:hypothetical protein